MGRCSARPQGAARLAQGDIARDAFQGEMSYDYGRILQDILDAAGRNRGGYTT